MIDTSHDPDRAAWVALRIPIPDVSEDLGYPWEGTGGPESDDLEPLHG